MLGNDYKTQTCSIAGALEVVGERWSLLIVRDVFLGLRRFDQIQANLGIARNVLQARLGLGLQPALLLAASAPSWGQISPACGTPATLESLDSSAAEKLPGDFVFVATAGHEIGHGGMELFLEQGAPSPQDTLAWVHLGASNACFAVPEPPRLARGSSGVPAGRSPGKCARRYRR